MYVHIELHQILLAIEEWTYLFGIQAHHFAAKTAAQEKHEPQIASFV